MNRPNFPTSFKWQNLDNARPRGSLILTQPSSPSSNHRLKLQQMIHIKTNTINRYNSQQELHRVSNRHNSQEQIHRNNNNRPQFMITSQINMRDKNPQYFHVIDYRKFPKQQQTKLNKEQLNNKPNKQYKQQTNKQQVNKQQVNKAKLVPLKFSSYPPQIAQPELIRTYRSQKTIPSFLRPQVKPHQTLKPTKKTITKDNFKIIKRMGEGKFGNVFLARQVCTGMIVALKAMNKKKIIEQNFLVQFTRELKIQMFLDHPNIIKNYGFFSDQEYFYIIMQLGCDGQLYDIMALGEPLSQQSTAYIIGNLLQAVHAMHKHKILHRDIKPQNIVLVHGNVKLCDFGWAVNKKQQLRSTFCGTPLYLSPQLLQGSRYDEKVDLWAVGVLAYQLHIGQSPFSIVQHEDLVKIVTDQVQFPSNKTVSIQFKTFIREILRKNPKERMACQDLLKLDFIKNYGDFETCEDLCQ